MSERIKASQMQKLLKEEKLMLQEQVNTLQSQVEAQNQVCLNHIIKANFPLAKFQYSIDYYTVFKAYKFVHIF